MRIEIEGKKMDVPVCAVMGRDFSGKKIVCLKRFQCNNFADCLAAGIKQSESVTTEDTVPIRKMEGGVPSDRE